MGWGNWLVGSFTQPTNQLLLFPYCVALTTILPVTRLVSVIRLDAVRDVVSVMGVVPLLAPSAAGVQVGVASTGGGSTGTVGVSVGVSVGGSVQVGSGVGGSTVGGAGVGNSGVGGMGVGVSTTGVAVGRTGGVSVGKTSPVGVGASTVQVGVASVVGVGASWATKTRTRYSRSAPA